MAQLTKIEIQNQTYNLSKNLIGFEKITLKDKIISKKWSLFGTKHTCKINGDDYTLQTVLSLMHTDNNYLILLQNNQVLQRVKIVSKAHNMRGFMIGLGIGILVYIIFRS